MDTLGSAVSTGGNDIVNGLRNLNAYQYDAKCLDANIERSYYGMLLDSLLQWCNLQGLGKYCYIGKVLLHWEGTVT